MARNDGIDRTFARNRNLKEADIGNAQRHNERENEVYTNPDIVKEQTPYNVHFKKPSGNYQDIFEQMKSDEIISTRGLKADADHYGELIFDVNSAYFHNHGGYEFAKQFYEDAYKAAINIVGGEQYILSAVMHADERNRAMSEALGKDVFHYHLHVVYIPVVEKEVLWTKRCKDPALVGTVKERIMQVSSSKKWASKPKTDEQGNPILSNTGKKVLQKSYSLLQDDFYNAMRTAGYTDIERGEHGSTEEHLTIAQFKIEKEKERLENIETQINIKTKNLRQIEKHTDLQKSINKTYTDIENMGRKTLRGKLELTKQEADELKGLAKNGVSAKMEIYDLKQRLNNALNDARIWRNRYQELLEETKDFLAALKRAPKLVKEFIEKVLHMEPERKLQREPKKRAKNKER